MCYSYFQERKSPTFVVSLQPHQFYCFMFKKSVRYPAKETQGYVCPSTSQNLPHALKEVHASSRVRVIGGSYAWDNWDTPVLHLLWWILEYLPMDLWCYCSNEPQITFTSRMSFCLNMHNEAVCSILSPPNAHKKKKRRNDPWRARAD